MQPVSYVVKFSELCQLVNWYRKYKIYTTSIAAEELQNNDRAFF